MTFEPNYCFPLAIIYWVLVRIVNASMFLPVMGNSIKYLVPLNP